MYVSRYGPIERILPNLYTLTSFSVDSNIYVISSVDEAVIVDTGLGLDIDYLFREFSKVGVYPSINCSISNT